MGNNCQRHHHGEQKSQTSQSYYYRPKAEPFIYKSIPEKFQEFVCLHPQKPAIIVHFVDRPRQVLTYSDLHQKATRLAKHLVNLGIRTGDRVAVSVHNSVEWVLAEFGVFYAGGVAVNFIPTNRKGLAQTLVNLGCTGAILDWRWPSDSTLGEFLEALKDQIPVHIHIQDGESHEKGPLNFDDVLRDPVESREITLPNYINPDATCLMWSTSGSTGKSKLVPHSHATILNCWDTFVRGLGIKPEDVIFQEHSMAYGLGFPQHLVSWGGTHVYTNTNGIEGKKEREFVFDVMKKENGTVAFFPSFMLSEMDRLKSGGKSIPKLNTGLVTGQRLDQHTTEIYKKIGKNIRFGYGLTDTLLCTGTPHAAIEWDKEPIGSHIFPGIEFKIIAEDGVPVPFGEVGEICIRGQNCTKSYVRDDGSILPSLDEYGWFMTGDVGTLRRDGLLVVKGRKKEIIRRGDSDIFPTTVEGELMNHPYVEEVVVLGIPRTIDYHYLCACVFAKPGHSVDGADIQSFAKKIFLGKKELLPEFFLFIEDIPRLPSGKPDRLSLQRKVTSTLELRAEEGSAAVHLAKSFRSSHVVPH